MSVAQRLFQGLEIGGGDRDLRFIALRLDRRAWRVGSDRDLSPTVRETSGSLQDGGRLTDGVRQPGREVDRPRRQDERRARKHDKAREGSREKASEVHS